MKKIIVAGAALAAFFVNMPVAAMGEWETSVVNAIQSKQTYPRSAVKRGDEGTARIRVHVSADGTVQDVELLEETGSAILDREALRLPTKVGRVPSNPAGQSAAIEIPVVFRLSN